MASLFKPLPFNICIHPEKVTMNEDQRESAEATRSEERRVLRLPEQPREPFDPFRLRITAFELALAAWSNSGVAEAAYLVEEARVIEAYLRGIPPAVVSVDSGPSI